MWNDKREHLFINFSIFQRELIDLKGGKVFQFTKENQLRGPRLLLYFFSICLYLIRTECLIFILLVIPIFILWFQASSWVPQLASRTQSLEQSVSQLRCALKRFCLYCLSAKVLWIDCRMGEPFNYAVGWKWIIHGNILGFFLLFKCWLWH